MSIIDALLTSAAIVVIANQLMSLRESFFKAAKFNISGLVAAGRHFDPESRTREYEPHRERHQPVARSRTVRSNVRRRSRTAKSARKRPSRTARHRVGLTAAGKMSRQEDILMRKFAIAAAVAAFGSSAFAAGVDPQAYRCGDIHALIAARGFVYIGAPFQGFAVANANSCAADERLEPRSVATLDNRDCVVPYCESRPTQENNWRGTLSETGIRTVENARGPHNPLSNRYYTDAGSAVIGRPEDRAW
jgi:hypothetical protein